MDGYTTIVHYVKLSYKPLHETMKTKTLLFSNFFLVIESNSQQDQWSKAPSAVPPISFYDLSFTIYIHKSHFNINISLQSSFDLSLKGPIEPN